MWSFIGAAARTGVSLDRVRASLRARDPGQAAPVPPSFEGSVPAAVLVPVFEEGGETRVILTRRSSKLRSHTGQVSFPGGRVDPGEAPVDASLREAAEEVGIDPAGVEILGELGSLVTMSSRALITPFVGALSERPRLTPNPAEVDRAFDTALADLMADGAYHEELWAIGGDERPVHFFDLEGETVWGATAHILTELLLAVVVGQ